MVQVTEEPAALASRLPAPEQRLATTRPGKAKPEIQSRVELASASSQSQSGQAVDLDAAQTTPADSKPESTPVESTADSVAKDSATSNTATSNTTPDENPSKASEEPQLASADPAPAQAEPKPVPETTESAAPSPGTPAGDVNVSVGGLVSASLTDLSEPTTESKKPVVGEAVAAPTPSAATATGASPAVAKSEPPSGRRRMMTDQPHPLDEALRTTLADLPELPAGQTSPQSPSPTRIGAVADATAHAGDLNATDVSVTPDTRAAMDGHGVRTVSHDSQQVPFATTRREAAEDQPADDLAGPLDQVAMDELYAELLKRVSKQTAGETATERERRQIIARYLMVLAGDPENAISSMEGLNENEQQYLRNHLLGLWTLIDPAGHPSSGRRLTEALPHFREANLFMSAATDSLSLNSLEFCTEIEAYGQIKPFEGNRFSAGQQVILYCEVENFAASERSGLYQTRLQGSYDIYNASGTKVVSQLLPVDEQRSRNLLRDYFVAYQMNLPKQLPAGSYRLQLTIEDMMGKKYGQANIPFEIR